MTKLKWGIPMVLILFGIGAALLSRKGGDDDEEETDNVIDFESGEKKTPRNIADDERRKIMSEMGKKGAKKSAEVRRAKKKAKEGDE